ncbi:MAG: hypothetical protein KGD67_09330 [Candidatus Lokiarchaeota archaeon]|nr:hypothetical protein [Candidatus Lokiarchaeota archaeon]
MKKPKELQKKAKINPESKKEQIYATFRKMFDKLNNIYEPYYSVDYLKMGKPGKYSDLVAQTIGGYKNLEQKHFLLMAKEQETIEFYVNWERLGNINLKGKLYYDLDNHFKFFKNLYEQMAYHEYGHTYLTTSTSSMFYPTEGLNFLKTNNIKNIYDIPDDNIAEFQRIVEDSKQSRIHKTLKNINFKDIAIGVSECHANYSMRNILKVKEPIEFMKFSKVDLLDGLHDYSKFNVDTISKDYINQRINNWVIKANDLFIFDKWDSMKQACEKYNFLPLFEFAYDLNQKYLEIVEKSVELAEMKKEILALAIKTNKLDFKELFIH